MKTYQIDRMNGDRCECTYFVKGNSRIDAFARAEGYSTEELERVETRVDGRRLIISDPSYTSSTFEVLLAR